MPQCTTKALVPLNLQNDSVARVKMISESWQVWHSHFQIGPNKLRTGTLHTMVRMASPKISKEKWQMELSISRVACVGLELNASVQSMDCDPKISQMFKPLCSTTQWHPIGQHIHYCPTLMTAFQRMRTWLIQFEVPIPKRIPPNLQLGNSIHSIQEGSGPKCKSAKGFGELERLETETPLVGRFV